MADGIHLQQSKVRCLAVTGTIVNIHGISWSH